jgi:hypothetical protein
VEPRKERNKERRRRRRRMIEETKGYKKTKNSRDEIHETHIRMQFMRP